MVPDFIQTVTAPTLDEKAYDVFKFQRSRLQSKDQDYPFDNVHQGKTYHQTKSVYHVLRCLKLEIRAVN